MLSSFFRMCLRNYRSEPFRETYGSDPVSPHMLEKGAVVTQLTAIDARRTLHALVSHHRDVAAVGPSKQKQSKCWEENQKALIMKNDDVSAYHVISYTPLIVQYHVTYVYSCCWCILHICFMCQSRYCPTGACCARTSLQRMVNLKKRKRIWEFKKASYRD